MSNLQHRYFDTAKLNAQYDLYPPLQGLGAGSLSTGGLGSLGGRASLGQIEWLGDPDEQVRDAQGAVNVDLKELGCQGIAEDGVLGPNTCGAIQYALEHAGDIPGGPISPVWLLDSCESFSYACKAAAPTTAKPPVTTTPPPPLTARAGGGGSNWLLIGGLVAAVAIAGAMVLKKKGR